jgi:uncharacterized protein
MAGKFVLKASGDQSMFNLHAGNGQIVLTSERYVSKSSALNGIESVKTNAADDARYELSEGGTRFSLKAGNGQVIGTSQTYTSESAAREGMQAVKRAAADATTQDLTTAPA